MGWNVLRVSCAAWMLACSGAHAAVDITPPNLGNATAGSLAGGVSVTPSGASTYSVSFPVPPGTAGVAPAVGLTYNSQAGSDMSGLGWKLSGQSQITRCAKIMAIDGIRRPVKLDADDVFCLDGQRLILKSGTTTEYRTEIDGFGRITAVGTDANGPASWKRNSPTGPSRWRWTSGCI